MTAAHLTAAEARALGIDAKPTKSRGTRRTAPGPYRTVCHDCGETFTTRAGEDRHVAPGHCRYDLMPAVVAGAPPPAAATAGTQDTP